MISAAGSSLGCFCITGQHEGQWPSAGSLITPGTVIPPRSLVMGSPGKVVRTLEEDQIPLSGGYHQCYLDLAKTYVSPEGLNLV